MAAFAARRTRQEMSPGGIEFLIEGGAKMTRNELAGYVKTEFGKDLQGFLKQKIEEDALYDYEIAAHLNISKSLVRKLRYTYGIKKADAFKRRFESTYGEGAVEEFKKMVQHPNNSLSDVGRYFGFSREYARQVYQKIYGVAYTKAHRKKRLIRRKKRLTDHRAKSKRMANLLKVSEKMKSVGLDANIENRGRSFIILNNGYRLDLRVTSTPVRIGRQNYFRFNIAKRVDINFDFFICLCRNRGEDVHFIIPFDFLPRSSISLLPHSRSDQSKYARFREGWSLLSDRYPRGRRRIR